MNRLNLKLQQATDTTKASKLVKYFQERACFF